MYKSDRVLAEALTEDEVALPALTTDFPIN